MIVWQNPDLAAEIREGLAAAERGETVDRGSFQQYLDDNGDED
jgi:predicted transcriptional regulator